MIVIDASAWIEYLTGGLADGLVTLLEEEETVSPPHVDFEVGSALRRMERQGRIEASDASWLISAMSTLPFERVRAPEDAVTALRYTNNATYADGWYLAMARRLSAPIMTTDAGMIDAARIHAVEVAG